MKDNFYDMFTHTHTQTQTDRQTTEGPKIKSTGNFFLCLFFSVVFALSSLFFSAKPAFASQQIIFQVEIPPKVIVTVEGETIQAIYSNVGRPPIIKEVVWKNQGRMITADDMLIRKFLSLSATLDWQKAGIIYKRETILEKIVSLLS